MSDHVPSYRRHRQSGQAITTLVDVVGNRRDVLLGKYGTKASRVEYARIIAEWECSGRNLPTTVATGDIMVSELIVRFLPWVREHYRHNDGTPTREADDIIGSLRPVNHLYASTSAKDFGPLALKAVRQLLITGYTHPKYGPQPALSRGVINQRIGRIRRMFRWAAENELVPPAIHHGLLAVSGLQRGRSAARETKPVLPVARAVVDDTIPVLRPMIADMVRLQLETGMRPGELVTMRAIDVDMTGSVWLYRPGQHKTAHHGHQRIVPIGPKGQEIIRRYLTLDTHAYLFSPKNNMAERTAALRIARKSRVQPSQQNRRKKKLRKQPGEAYTTQSYYQAITKAISRHNGGKPESERIPHWHPHQLRHLRALELKREAGLDVARAVLGHRSPCITEHYATLDIATASEVMARIG